MSNFPDRPVFLALALILGLGPAAPALAEGCVSESFLHRLERSIEGNDTLSEGGDAEIMTGTGQGLREIRFLRPDYALTSFHATGDGEDASPDPDRQTGAGGRIYLGYVDYDPALLTGDPAGDFVFGGSFIAVQRGERVEIACMDPGKIDASIVISTLEAVGALERAAGGANGGSGAPPAP